MSGLGLTRDPYMMTSTDNMWINVGQSQFHLPTGRPEVLRGVTGLVLPDREALLARLGRLRGQLAGTGFAFRESNDGIEAISPWGNVILCHAPDPERFGPLQLGMAYVRFDVRPGTAAGIARFYREVLGAARGNFSTVPMGRAPASAAARISISCSRKRMLLSRLMTAIMCRSISPISPARTGAFRRSASSPR